ncbi:hypothetical protein CAPTEDRAFT_212893 [Capitella teleta]|uniref:ShKT domain-containing protein n=1 Tax=Capitella teleta TaxID=283909 RepID=R7TQQ1_CAPTE|nr:hypothetical protein CAPTEDRAFT_212893 [Capitella teleta]|eukprot:ELT93350.1 hypothetical protein CAPTEDRAFT_212893 [Capitella teleta]
MARLCRRGLPEINVNTLSTSESGLCYDVADKCALYARQGKCVNSDLHRYANYCRKSCGLCDFAPTTNHECVFPVEMHGTWVVFWAGKKEELSISDGNITTSTLGTYVCKGKHWQKNYYKVFSAYENGCTLTDESFSICKFEEQTIAPAGLLRNGALHTLLRRPIVKLGSCGIRGTVAINATFSNWVNCAGIMSDIDPHSCMRVNRLLFKFDTCHLKTEYALACIAYAVLPNGASLIVTEDRGVSIDYICWVARSDLHRGPFSTAHPFQMTRAECSTGATWYPLPESQQLTVVKASSAISEEACEYHNQPHWLQRSPSVAQLDSAGNRISSTALPEVRRRIAYNAFIDTI